MGLNFSMTLAGNMAGAANAAAVALAAAEKGLHGAKKGTEIFEGEIGKLSGSVGGLKINLEALGSAGGTVFTFDLAEAAHVAFEAISKVVEKVIDLGKEIVHVSAEKQDLDFSVVASGGQEALEVVENVVRARDQLGARTSNAAMERSLLPFLNLGVKDTRTLGNLLDVAGDSVARLGERGSEVLPALEKVLKRGGLNMRILDAIGMKKEDFAKDLGEAFGMAPAAALKRAEKGALDGASLFNFVINEFDKKRGGLGSATTESAKTLGGVIDRLMNMPANIFEEQAHSPAMAQLADSLERITTALKGESGAAIVKGISDAVGEVASQLSEVNIDRVFKDAATFAGNLSTIVSGVATVVGGIADSFRWISVQVERAQYGAKVLEGLIHGELVGPSDEKGGHKTIDIEEVLGMDAIPRFAAGGIVDRPTLALVGESGPEMIVPLGSGGGGRGPSIVWNGDVIVQGSGADANALAQTIAQQIRAEFVHLVDEVAAEYGKAA